MINMLRADFYRLIRSKGFYIALLILMLTIGVSIYFVGPGYIGINDSGGTIDDNVSAQLQNTPITTTIMMTSTQHLTMQKKHSIS